ncbi:hypothetical protein Vretimale_19523 [Volvox reticuliferus]|uniref:BTB domain-containing protein n=1 Tax=Volvox reticuliferus TaxID=1737510 RepID=A0A8J4FQB5_9CHLO|nr:hypothetical protein Vretifemale_14217 [Volvox reticuliferus]GIM16955.1 hypothetical protein Vretimale_19523 [Volvox reticuliferus]
MEQPDPMNGNAGTDEVERDTVGATASDSAACDLRLVCRDGTLAANKCLLSQASTVLRQTLGLQLPTPGELQLPSDNVSAWEVVLRLVSLELYPLLEVNMDNVGQLLVMADKYDMPIVRGTCAHFLSLNVAQLRLDAPLESASNILTAASLVSKYCSTQAALKQYVAAVGQRLDTILTPLRRPVEYNAADRGAEASAVLLWHMELLQLLGQLDTVVRTVEYVHSVAAEVQVTVSSAMLSGLRHLAMRLPPTCQHCDALLPFDTKVFHEDCAKNHFTELHTKGCHLCNVSMLPSHARFCNSCAYRRKK